MRQSDLWKGVFLVAIGASIYGMLATFVKLAYKDGFTTAEVTSSQFIIGILGMLILNTIQTFTSKKELPKPEKKDLIRLILAGTSLGFTSLFYYLSVLYINVSIGIVLLMQSVWIGVVVESILSKTFPSTRKIISTVLILIGTILATNALNSGIHLDVRGIFWGMMAACSFSTTMFTANRIGNYLPVFRKSILMLSGGLIVVLLYALFSQIIPYYTNPSESLSNLNELPKEVFNVSIFWKYGLFLAVFGTILPPILFNLGFPKVGLGLGSILSSLELPVSVLFAFILLNEQVLTIQWIGIAMILSAIVLMNLNVKGNSVSH